ncbi:stage II sporulation protein M [Cellulomonas chengniuliangii]|uniref:Stage II sporulation protein M n=1 Tax=Cellulomonas chengniuliangii TaxID=2968084 RepID=A0ABY5KXQ3_9CELL|nr:stage II sporulation protein M [Cellulomonas chengniuliangii]MCC2308773.1 stage II sporulation protein M [Cellulomonas chengniuliangii]MCC2316903.1 stage II sporulation protein M [Cellulomonas chengniuliangii]UUI74478.1 stage II sporulation protein M [Cellulomonas chengniuliangii]
MDLDAFTAVHSPGWERLDELARRRRLSGAEVDELVRLYQAVATDLSRVRSSAPDPELVTRLSQLLARARARIAGAHEPAWRDVIRFVVVSLPAALYRIRWWTIGVTAACLAIAVVAGVWVATQPAALAMMGTESQRLDYVENAFASYYDPGIDFATMVWTNNAWIAALCVGLGITGIGPAYVLLNNAVSVGATGGMMAAHGELALFLQLISPHGLMELTAIFVAGAAGLRLFWTWVDPGPRPRARALAEEGRSLFTVALGLVGVLLVSGLVEGFVTGSDLPWSVKIIIGAAVLAAFWAYTLVLGRRAVADGETGDLEDDRAGYSVAVAG